MKADKSMKYVLLAAGITLLSLAACLQPAEFVPGISIDGITIDGETEVNGEIEYRFMDTAVLWLVNTTTSVDIKELTVQRIDDAEGYPRSFYGQKNGSSLASYHQPTDVYYNISVDYVPVDPFPDLPSDINVANSTGTKSLHMQMPRARDYVLYIYRDDITKEIVFQPEEAEQYPDSAIDKAVPPPPPPSSRENAHPLIIKNLTAAAVITGVDFTSVNGGASLTYGDRIEGGEGNAAFLTEGSYRATINYQKANQSGTADAAVQAHIEVIDSGKIQSLHTLYAYFYLGNDGVYYLTQQWPPLLVPPASSTVDPSKIYDDQGLLMVTNRSAQHKIINGISWGANDNPTEIPVYIHANTIGEHSNQQAIPLPVGTGTLRFKVEGNNHWGAMVTHLEIKSGQVTEIEYIDGMEYDNYIPDGAGAIKITNNASVYSVTGVRVIEYQEPSNGIEIDDSQFSPYPGMIGKGASARIIVASDAEQEYTLKAGQQLVQIIMAGTSTGNEVRLERVETLLGRTIEITITDEEVDGSSSNNARRVPITIENQSQWVAVSAAVSRDETHDSAVYTLNRIQPGRSESFDFRSSSELALIDGDRYTIAVYLDYAGQGEYRTTIYKTGRILYAGTPETIIVTPYDVENSLGFVPVTGIKFSGSQLLTDASELSNVFSAEVMPPIATNRNIVWTVVNNTYGDALANVTSNGYAGQYAFNDNGITAAGTSKKVTLRGRVVNGTGAGQDFEQFFEVLCYNGVGAPPPPASPPTKIELNIQNYSLGVGESMVIEPRVYSGDYLMQPAPEVTFGFQSFKGTGDVTIDGNKLTGKVNGKVNMTATVETGIPGLFIAENFVVTVEVSDRTVKLILRRSDTWAYDVLDTIEIYRVPKSQYTDAQLNSGDSGTDWYSQWYSPVLTKFLNKVAAPLPVYDGVDIYGAIQWGPPIGGEWPTKAANAAQTAELQARDLDRMQYVVMDIPNNKYRADDGEDNYVYKLRWRESHGIWRGYKRNGGMIDKNTTVNYFIVDVDLKKRVAKNPDGSIAYYYVIADMDCENDKTAFVESSVNLFTKSSKPIVQNIQMLDMIGPLKNVGGNSNIRAMRLPVLP